jgi:cell division transport system permease protein
VTAALPLLPREGDGRQRFLMWIIALMAYLAALAMIGAFMVGNAIGAWRSTVGGVATVVDTDPARSDADAARIVDGLLAVDGVAAAREVPAWELNALLSPWLPDAPQSDSAEAGGHATDLPLPRVFEVVLGGAEPAAVESVLADLAPGAELMPHERPMTALVRMGSSIQLIGGLIVLLVLAAATGTVVFTTRASLVIHRPMIDLIHNMGATDRHVAGPFRMRALRHGLIGGLVGVGAAVLTLLLVAALADAGTGGLARAALGGWQWAAVAAVPVLFGLIPMATAHLTVMRALARLP